MLKDVDGTVVALSQYFPGINEKTTNNFSEMIRL
jgi:hypothetical protein